MNNDPGAAGESDGVGYVAGTYDNVTYLADGTTALEASVVSNLDPERAREIMADFHGMDTEDVVIREVDGKPYDAPARLGRKSVAFSSARWHSSWNPGADPSQN